MSDTYSPQKDSALSYDLGIAECRQLALDGKLETLFGQNVTTLFGDVTTRQNENSFCSPKTAENSHSKADDGENENSSDVTTPVTGVTTSDDIERFGG